MTDKHPRVQIWVPGLAETGGIQHYSACFIRALEELYPKAKLDVLAKNDVPNDGRVDHGPNTTVRRFGAIPGGIRTAAFATSGIFLGWRDRPVVSISTHPHFSKAQVIAKRLAGVPYLTCAHGIETWGHLQGSILSALKGAAGVLPVSEFTRRALVSQGGLAPNLVKIVPDTFESSAFSSGPKPTRLLERYGLHPHQPILLTVGRLAASEAYKGQDRVIEALKSIRQTLPETRYIIVGSGDDRDRLEQLAINCGQKNAVIFAGYVPQSELPDYYRLCDAFVMPSTGEGFGIVYLEALASGRPCIVGNRDASPEAIGGGRLGMAIDPMSVPAIENAILQVLTGRHDKPWLREPETLRREVIELFGFATFKKTLASAIDQLAPSLATGG